MATKLIPLGDLATALNLPMAWLKAEAEAGRLPHLHVGRRLMFDLDAVHAALVERTRPVVTIAAMIDGLRSDDLVTRVQAGFLLVKSAGTGMVMAGLGDLDMNEGAGRDLLELVGRAISGEVAAADELDAALTADPALASKTPRESSRKTGA